VPQAILLLPPFFILFEMAQLVVAERYIGVKQIRGGIHPLEQHPRGPRLLPELWLGCLIVYWFYMVALLFVPGVTFQAFILVFVTLLGTSLRRSFGMRWALVVMTFEGAIRMGLLINILVNVFLHGGDPAGPW